MNSARSEIPLVFIELGRSIPKFVKDNLIYVRKNFPSQRVIVVADYPIEIAGIEFIDANQLKRSKTLDQFDVLSENFSRNVQRNYWISTSRRFFFLEMLMSNFKLDKVIHLESDVVFLNLEQVLNEFDASFEIAYSLQSRNLGCAGIFLVKSRVGMSSFVDFFVKYLDTHYTSDMKVLAKWFQLNQDKVLVLQPVPSEMQFDVPLKSKYFYDPGDFGIFFFGNDARHNRLPIGKIRQVTNRSSFSNFLESEGTIQGKITNAKKINSTFVFALENTSISLNSIHMHSKFMPKSKRHLGMRISFLNMSHRIMFVDYLIFPFPMLDIRVFFERFISAIARRTNLQMGYRDFRLR